MKPLENIMAVWSADKPEVKEGRPIGKRKGIFRQMRPEPLESATESMPTSPSPEEHLIALETFLEEECGEVNLETYLERQRIDVDGVLNS